MAIGRPESALALFCYGVRQSVGAKKEMYKEIEECVCFLTAFMYGRIPRRRVDLFAEHLANLLVRAVQRSLSNGELVLELNVQDRMATTIVESARAMAMDVRELASLLPAGLTLRLSAGAVSYSVGDGPSVAVYREDGSLLLNPIRETSSTRPPLRLLHVGDRDNTRIFQLATTPTGGRLLVAPDDFARTRFGSSRPKSILNIPRRFLAIKTPSPSVLSPLLHPPAHYGLTI